MATSLQDIMAGLRALSMLLDACLATELIDKMHYAALSK